KYGYLLEGWKLIGGKMYYLTPNDFYAKTGWQTISGRKYYFHPTDAYMYTGWQTIGGKKYYFGTNGVMVTGKQTINGQVCTFNSSGVLVSGSAVGGTASTATATSTKIIWNSSPYVTSAVTNTWAKSTDSDMPFDVTTKRNAAFVNNMLAYATYFVGKMDYASSVTNNDPNGLRFRRLISGGKTDCSWFVYHVLYKYGLAGEEFIHSYQWGNDPSTYPGGVNIGTDISKASPGDIICTGKGTQSSNSHVMIYLGGGKVVECAAGYGVILSNAPSSCRQIVHFSCLPNNPGADYTKSTTGTWVKSGTDYKFKVGSSYLTNCFQNIDGDIYYFNANGVRLTGWKKIGGKMYYFTSDGKMYLRWKRINGKKYYFDPISGYMHTGWEWVAENNAWYYLDPSSGALVTGWQTIDGKKYYFDSGNKMVTGTRTIDGKSYTFGSDGVLK
ncbi:MAG: C40 family peptidase, partial [Firmicutes bacterium]|nr:C40 family peptidase [Bacillota bacterium]